MCANRGRMTCKTVLAAVALLLLTCSGCGGAAEGSPASTVTTAGQTDARIDTLLTIIDEVGMADWAAFGRDLQRRGLIRVVGTETLPPEFNAYAWVGDDCIWYGEIAFERYGTMDQSAILLHELVHIRTGEVTHEAVNEVCDRYAGLRAAADEGDILARAGAT